MSGAGFNKRIKLIRDRLIVVILAIDAVAMIAFMIFHVLIPLVFYSLEPTVDMMYAVNNHGRWQYSYTWINHVVSPIGWTMGIAFISLLLVILGSIVANILYYLYELENGRSET